MLKQMLLEMLSTIMVVSWNNNIITINNIYKLICKRVFVKRRMTCFALCYSKLLKNCTNFVGPCSKTLLKIVGGFIQPANKIAQIPLSNKPWRWLNINFLNNITKLKSMLYI